MNPVMLPNEIKDRLHKKKPSVPVMVVEQYKNQVIAE